MRLLSISRACRREWVGRIEHPGTLVLREPNLRVVRRRLRCSQQYQHRSRPHPFSRLLNQLRPDPPTLMGLPDGQVRQVANIAKVCQRTRNTNQEVSIPSRYDQIRVGQHLGHYLPVINRPPLAERRLLVQVDDLGKIQIISVSVLNAAHATYSRVIRCGRVIWPTKRHEPFSTPQPSI